MSVQTGVVQVQPEVEVVAKAERRRFTAEYKRRILREAAACTKPGEIGALLRREGLCSKARPLVAPGPSGVSRLFQVP